MAAKIRKNSSGSSAKGSVKSGKALAKPQNKRRPAGTGAPRPGDWLVHTPDRETLLDFGRDLAQIRNRLKRKQIMLADCFLSRVPFEPGEPMELGAAELEVF